MATERTLSHEINRQDNGYYCGPAATRVALTVRGIYEPEPTLAAKLGTTVNGTDSANNVTSVLNSYVGNVYASVFIPSNTATPDQISELKTNLVKSVDAGYAIVVNVVGTGRDVDGNSYSYSGGHFFSVVGYRASGDQALAMDNAIGRDYWISTDALAIWIAARGYSTAANAVAAGPVVPAEIPPGSPFPLPAGHYYGDIAGPAESHGGFYDNEKPAIAAIQRRLIVTGNVPGHSDPNDGWADGIYEAPTTEAVKSFQTSNNLVVDGNVGPVTWSALFPAVVPPPQPPTLFGWDMSDFDWDRGTRPSHIATAAAEGVRILTHKATEHATDNVYKHMHMAEMLAAGRDAGIPFLAPYVVVRSGVPIETQATTAIDFVREQAPWWFEFPGRFWQVDLEKWPYDAVSPDLGEELCVELESRTGIKALLYASAGEYGDTLPGTRPLWNANYEFSGASRPFKQQWADVVAAGAPGWVTYSGRSPVLYQFASDAVIGGASPSDASAFRGTEADFSALIPVSVVIQPPPVDPPPVEPPTTSCPSANEIADAVVAALVNSTPYAELLEEEAFKGSQRAEQS
ncbi:MAG TPA: C39 family peptidase [Candidatus Paceibacterota bacterium]